MLTAKLKVLKRSNRLFYDSMNNSSYLSNSFKKIVPLWNNLPAELKTKKWTYDTIKTKFKDFFQDEFKHQIDTLDFCQVGRTTGFLFSLISLISCLIIISA